MTELRIDCASDSSAERTIRDELVGFLSLFDLAPWTFTHRVVVEEGAIPHSHPVLTLGTVNRGPFLLASYLHEQLHWFLVEQGSVVEEIYDEVLRPRYPTVPVGLPEGAPDEDSTYLHLIVCWLEVAALRSLLGRDRADTIAQRLSEAGPYRWVYRTVLDDFEHLRTAYEGRGLIREDGEPEHEGSDA